MESNNYEGFITSIVENFLPCFSSPEICMTMSLRMSWTKCDSRGRTYFSGDGRETLEFKKNHFLLFYRPSNYTKVLYKDITDERIFYPDSYKELVLKQLSDHDSCWRSDGMRWIFQSFVEAWDFFDSKGIEGRDIDPFVHWDLSGEPSYRLIEKIEAIDKDNRWISDYIVKVGKKIYMNEIGKYMPVISMQ